MGVVSKDATPLLLCSCRLIFKLSIKERTRNLIEPTLLTSSIFKSVDVFPCRLSTERTSSVKKASGPHPKDVNCIY